MPDALIENPILNSPFAAPARHFKFTDEGITNEIVEGRRSSSYFIPIARPKKKGKQLVFDTEWTQDRIEENKSVNHIRRRVGMWREGGHIGVTPTTAALLKYWTDPERERKLFFCQIEALETIIYINEVARKFGDASIEEDVRKGNDTSNPGLPRFAFKMATGSGKTVVMAMLIAWQSLNKLASPHDARFGDTFLLVSPGITIRDRLRVLLPNDPNNYYLLRDIVPFHQLEKLGQARIVITNFHAFLLREKISAGKVTKGILSEGTPGIFTESPDQMVRRVCRELGNKKNIIVINDEAHHCYRRKPEDPEVAETLVGDDRKEAEKRDNEAAESGSRASRPSKPRSACRAIFDLSATPFFLRGSGYPEGTLFPWVVSDFSLIDAIESGIVKVPRVPVSDDSMQGDQPTYRDLWARIREHLPRKGRKTEELDEEPKLPAELEGAIQSLYGNYKKYHKLWEQNADAQAKGITPPVFIIVCNNTNVSKLVFNYVSGWEKVISDTETIVVPGRLPHFNNEKDGRWQHAPELDLGRQRATRIRRGHERRLQKDRRPRDRGIQGRDTAPFPRPQRRQPHRRRPAPRGHEHRRQAR